MGLTESRQAPVAVDKLESGTPGKAPEQVQHRLLVDPRSPTGVIDRTPINIGCTPEPGNGVPFVDPRSPAADFHRTPIKAEAKRGGFLRGKTYDQNEVAAMADGRRRVLGEQNVTRGDASPALHK